MNAQTEKYYEFLKSIDGTMNPRFPIVNGQIPFESPQEAILYVMAQWPFACPSDHVITADRVKGALLATTLLPEVEMLLFKVEKRLEEAREEAKTTYAEAEKQPHDLMGKVNRTVLREEGIQKTGIASGLSEVWQLLHNRKYEMMRLSKGGVWSYHDPSQTPPAEE